jgi:GAF domain-containing protein
LIDSLSRGVHEAPDLGAALQFVCDRLHQQEPRYAWVGIYWVEGEELVLKAYCGPAATQHVRIPIGRGICGLAARRKQTVLVDDVCADPNYLACFPTTRSEIVVPILRDGRCLGEIDIDGDAPAAFDTLDKLVLEWVAELLAAKASGR